MRPDLCCRGSRTSRCLSFLRLLAAAGWDPFTEAATCIAYDIEAGVVHLGNEAGAKYSVQYKTPSRWGQCTGP